MRVGLGHAPAGTGGAAKAEPQSASSMSGVPSVTFNGSSHAVPSLSRPRSADPARASPSSFLPNTSPPLILQAKCGKAFEVDRGGMMFMSSYITDRLLKEPSWTVFQLNNTAESIEAVIKLMRGEDIDIVNGEMASEICDIILSLWLSSIRYTFLLKCKRMLPSWASTPGMIGIALGIGIDLKDTELIKEGMRFMEGAPPARWSLEEAEEIKWPVWHALVQAWDGSSSWAEAADKFQPWWN